ncbi:bifunctional 4-hydroxy-2-oxoglutarate aldolase/2-dehydro-3-deoxy-phosphogluconate aldolase (plasmid) [Embleya sp. NBC_00888]|uniref:bifunctional 4-hydroxy-2-oxoglutarate aldolase/2-dehydro-3-deoxy-phosphogluconate aldolase n=1 Tax=Embleya sp. NBC_00888 TaxID=2975960 RepID=UPI002F916671|nr:bifunctional 4-hydroxy-2-oxoglutarate aldolase/2-dehydro-3-deoxy-phosphogluconate aldolase [Embleya sp. NBC_00888]
MADHRSYRWDLMRWIARERVVSIIRAESADQAAQDLETLVDAGLTVIEVSLTTPGAADVIREASRAHPDVLIGAGTVLDTESARQAVAAGARLLVCPTLSADVIRTAHRYGAVVLPGCATPTEMTAAIEAGADAVKVFPASAWTPGALADVRAALPQLPLIPTGGISLEAAPAWIRAGAVAVGLGSTLTRPGATSTRTRVDAFRKALADGAG